MRWDLKRVDVIWSWSYKEEVVAIEYLSKWMRDPKKVIFYEDSDRSGEFCTLGSEQFPCFKLYICRVVWKPEKLPTSKGDRIWARPIAVVRRRVRNSRNCIEVTNRIGTVWEWEEAKRRGLKWTMPKFYDCRKIIPLARREIQRELFGEKVL